jgi:hypothetical protein
LIFPQSLMVVSVGPAIKGFFFPIEKPPQAPISPSPQLSPGGAEQESEARSSSPSQS